MQEEVVMFQKLNKLDGGELQSPTTSPKEKNDWRGQGRYDNQDPAAQKHPANNPTLAGAFLYGKRMISADPSIVDPDNRAKLYVQSTFVKLEPPTQHQGNLISSLEPRLLLGKNEQFSAPFKLGNLLPVPAVMQVVRGMIEAYNRLPLKPQNPLTVTLYSADIPLQVLHNDMQKVGLNLNATLELRKWDYPKPMKYT